VLLVNVTRGSIGPLPTAATPKAPLPVIVFGLLNIINPEYVEPMYSTEAGQLMLTIAVGGLLVGSWAMNKMAVLKY